MAYRYDPPGYGAFGGYPRGYGGAGLSRDDQFRRELDRFLGDSRSGYLSSGFPAQRSPLYPPYPSTLPYRDYGPMRGIVQKRQLWNELREQRQKNRAQKKETQSGGPKQILKKQQIPENEQTLTQHLKIIALDQPIIGLKHVVETILEHGEGRKATYQYDCELCGIKKATAGKLASHLVTKEHRRNYIKHHKLEEVDDKQLEKRAEAIQSVHGRGEWTVKKEAGEFIRLDKSAFLKKASKGGDVEMTDVSEKTGGLKEGDVVVEELVIDDDEDEVNPKLFVLQAVEKLLDENYKIDDDDEAAVVDQIIQKLDQALAEFVKTQNMETEDAAAGEGNGQVPQGEIPTGAPIAEVVEETTKVEADQVVENKTA